MLFLNLLFQTSGDVFYRIKTVCTLVITVFSGKLCWFYLKWCPLDLGLSSTQNLTKCFFFFEWHLSLKLKRGQSSQVSNVSNFPNWKIQLEQNEASHIGFRSDGKKLFLCTSDCLRLITVVSESVAMALSAILLLLKSSMDTAHNNHHISLVFRATTETPCALFSVSRVKTTVLYRIHFLFFYFWKL